MGGLKKGSSKTNIHNHTAEGYWTGERNAVLSIDTVAMFTAPDPDFEIRGEGRGGEGRGERGRSPKNFFQLGPNIRAGEEGNGGPGPPRAPPLDPPLVHTCIKGRM